MNVKMNRWIECLIVCIALAMGVYYLFPILSNPYVINDDVRIWSYWMAQFQDPELFQNDFLTDYSKSRQTWGSYGLYYLLSFVIDPKLLNSILPILLSAVAALFLYRLVQDRVGSEAGILASLAWIFQPRYIASMSGGHPRTFGFPLLILFLYFLIQRKHARASILLILQTLFYPIVFFVSVGTYFGSLIEFPQKLKMSGSKSAWKWFAVALALGCLVLGLKYGVVWNPSIGHLVTREAMVDQPEYYALGRDEALPVKPVTEVAWDSLRRGIIQEDLAEQIPALKTVTRVLLGGALAFFIWSGLRRSPYFKRELLFLFLSGIFMYILADFFLLKLYLPRRYLNYVFPVLGPPRSAST